MTAFELEWIAGSIAKAANVAPKAESRFERLMEKVGDELFEKNDDDDIDPVPEEDEAEESDDSTDSDDPKPKRAKGEKDTNQIGEIPANAPSAEFLSERGESKARKLFTTLSDASEKAIDAFVQKFDVFAMVAGDYEPPSVFRFAKTGAGRPLHPSVEAFDPEEPTASERKVTALFAVTPFTGKISFPSQDLVVTELKAGDALIFPSCCLHPWSIIVDKPAVLGAVHLF
jgi:hypothetical protein